MSVSARSSGPASTAGIVVWRRSDHAGDIEILLVHPGGPFWAKKDAHAWSIPKGEFDPEIETPHAAALREFDEEMGLAAPAGEVFPLDPFRAGKKRLHAFAVEGDLDVDAIQPSDTHRSMVELEWPPRSGQTQHFPEVDRAGWFRLGEAADKLHKGQRPLVDQLETKLPPRGQPETLQD